jgi:hypothetical protein
LFAPTPRSWYAAARRRVHGRIGHPPVFRNDVFFTGSCSAVI